MSAVTRGTKLFPQCNVLHPEQSHLMGRLHHASGRKSPTVAWPRLKVLEKSINTNGVI